MRHDFTDEPTWLEFSPDAGGYLDPAENGESYRYPDTWFVTLEDLHLEFGYYPSTPVHTTITYAQQEVLDHLALARERSLAGDAVPF